MGFYSGVFNTTVNPTELNKRSFAATMLRLFPDGSAPIFSLTSETGRSSAKASTHGYFTKTLTLAWNQINNGAGYTNVATVFVVDSTAGFLPDQILHCPRTQENIRIVSVDSATQITVVRAFGRVAAAALVDNDFLLMVGTAHAEGSARPTARGLTTVYVSNFTQIFRNAWALTDTARASYTEMGFENIAENKKDCMLLHSVDMESAIIFGQPKMDVSGTQPRHSTQGIIDACEQYAPANTNTAGGTTNLTQLETLFEPAFQFSHDLGDTKSRMVYTGSTGMKVFNKIARLNGTVQIMNGQNSFGFKFTTFQFYKGTLYLVEHPMLNGFANISGLAIAVDMPALKLAYMDGRDTRPEEYGGTGKNNANGADAQGGSLTTEFATELLNPAGCAVIYGLTDGANG
jgi:hypothetical protein